MQIKLILFLFEPDNYISYEVFSRLPPRWFSYTLLSAKGFLISAIIECVWLLDCVLES